MRALDTSPPPISVIAFEVSISESTTEAMDIGFSESFVSVLTFFDEVKKTGFRCQFQILISGLHFRL